MGLVDSLASRLGYTRLADGTHRYTLHKNNTTYVSPKQLMETALNNPITYACIEIRAKVLAQAEFYVLDSSGNKIEKHPVLDLIKEPNSYQSKEDFLKQLEWFKCVHGWVYQRPYGSAGSENAKALFNLNPQFIEFPDKFESSLIFTDADIAKFNEQIFKYKEPDGKDIKEIEFGNIIPFYDTGNSIDTNDTQRNPLISPSRIMSIIKPISNSNLALDAENVMIQTNGRELFMGGAERGFNLGAALPMEHDDKSNIEKNLIDDYGVTGMKKRAMATNQRIEWQSLHIKLKELGLHESISNNANLIREAFSVPNELYKAFQSGSTYENQKEALISFVQSTIQPIADDLASSWASFFKLKEKNLNLVASFEHLPVMQHTEEKKAEKILKISTAFQRLVAAGISTEDAKLFIESQGVSFNE
jgi:hypothetical protein